MTTFDEREAAFENQFAHQQMRHFLATTRSHRLLGLWAAALLGKDQHASEHYVTTLLHKELEAGASGHTLKCIIDDLHGIRSIETVTKKHRQILADVMDDLCNDPNQTFPQPSALPQHFN